MANAQKDGEAVPVENIVLVGSTGTGKSATGNSIAGEKVFVSKAKGGGVTMECKSVIVETHEGPKLRVIDTPGLFDATSKPEYISKQIINCLHLAEGGLHAVLLVFTVRNRVTAVEEKVLSTLEVIFGSQILDYLIVVFTAGDELEDNEETIQDYLKDCPKFLERLLEGCDQRLVVFDNKTKDEPKKTKQVHELLNLIDRVRKHNSYKPYTEDMYLKIKEEKERHQNEHDELAKKDVTEEEFQKLRTELMLINEQNLKAMEKMMEDNIKMISDAQQKLFEQREKAELDRHHAEEERHQKEMQAMLSQMEITHQNEMNKQMDQGHACNIL